MRYRCSLSDEKATRNDSGNHFTRLLAVACLACLAFIALEGAAAAAPGAGFAGAKSPLASLLHRAGIGCRLVGGSLVCGRDGGGGGLLDRKILPRKKTKEKPVQKKTYPAKKPSSGSGYKKPKSSGSRGGGSVAPASPAPVETVPEEEEAEEEEPATRACPPGHMVLTEPNAAGSHCEPVGTGKPAGEPSPSNDAPAAPPKETAPAAAPEVAAGSTEIPDDIQAAACGPVSAPSACACPGGSAYDSDACKTAIPSCCSAKVSADGKPQPVISRCGADQNKAMSAVVSSAKEKKLTLGPVRCTNR